MIQKFRWKFIGAAIGALFLVLILTLGSLVGVSYVQNQKEVDRVLTTLVKNEGHLSPHNAQPAFGNQNDPINRNFLAGKYNPEAVYQYRYFSVVVGSDQRIKMINDNNVYKLKNSEINSFLKKVLARKDKRGNIKSGENTYAYQVSKDSMGHKLIVFLNETLIYQRFWLILRLAIALGILALLIFSLVLILVSGKAIKPIKDTYHKQQEFITNAGHELKTPLAVISANTEMEEMLGNDSEWNQSNKEQVAKLTKLVNRLISLARAGETGELTLSKVDFSKIVEDGAQDFKSVMKKNDLTYQVSIQKDLKVIAEQHSLAEVVNILLDNARKYCDPHGKVRVELAKSTWSKNVVLRVSNTYRKGKNEDYTHFFDRFYREDESHNSKKDGFGIGLAMARELIEIFHGKISVSHKGEDIMFTVSLKNVK
ncbi:MULTISPECIES: cell wall metabolism sensor histidine kinase WalK [Lactobacillus]|uniref:histidine kinase n=1 Tax=Lactobacillus xujianguonis TaxID=2495899 RepID=A0A437SVT2_9LACO|nr:MULTISPECIES: HAMP domain-containing sensor histidine kinase [Lactobacillus]RVU71002.1 HAMP domain-containing histidine kinase [Lactobacillus xujianguonis]RVU73928.1 HAMP domain-containing histidine kinase [Lactobacillus xujianguonis]